MASEFEKSRARDEITDFVLQNCLAHHLGEERPVGYGPAFNPIGFLGRMAQPGDLLLLSGTQKKGWSLCWLHRIATNRPENRYLCESIETGEISWWSNVGIEYLDRNVVEFALSLPMHMKIRDGQGKWLRFRIHHCSPHRCYRGGGCVSQLRARLVDSLWS